MGAEGGMSQLRSIGGLALHPVDSFFREFLNDEASWLPWLAMTAVLLRQPL